MSALHIVPHATSESRANEAKKRGIAIRVQDAQDRRTTAEDGGDQQHAQAESQ